MPGNMPAGRTCFRRAPDHVGRVDGARFYDNLECYGSFVYLRGGARNSPFAQPSLVERIGIVRQERGVDRNRKRRDGRGGDDESVGDGASEYDGYVLVVETRIVERIGVRTFVEQAGCDRFGIVACADVAVERADQALQELFLALGLEFGLQHQPHVVVLRIR